LIHFSKQSRAARTAVALSAFVFATVLVFVATAMAGEKKTADGGKAMIKCGTDIGDSPIVTLADVNKAPDKYMEKPVLFEGTVQEVCQKKGCWMEIVAGDGKQSIRVTFKDYGFFVPKDAHGMIARTEGTFHTKVWSKEDADHLEGEGAQLVRNADGTATELGFIATGVELKQPKEAETPPAKSKNE